MSTTLNTLTIAEAAEGLRKKEFSSKELTEQCLGAADKKNSELRAYLEIHENEARAMAEKADLLLANANDEEKKHLPLLLGIPLAFKDNILIKGKRTTAGSNILANYTASYDATVTTKLREAGTVFLGKTNLDEFAMGSSTENSAFGPTKHPRDLKRVPGGSSGGSAVAVAANLSLGALGSDTGGSIRQPASFCGIVGFKPTYGSVSRHGLIAMASSLDQIGPFAKTVTDAEIIFKAIRGKDVFDATTIETPAPTKNPKRLRIGVPKEYFEKGLDADVSKKIQSVIDAMGTSGAEIKEITLPHSKYALPTYYIVVPSEVSANLARFDGIRYGYSAEKTNSLLETYTESRARGFGAEVKRRIILGTYTLSSGYYDAYYLKAQKVRTLILNDFKKAFDDVDVIMGPTTPTPAFLLGEKTNDPVQMYLADIYTVAVNLAGLPAISIPAGDVERDGVSLPVGLQIIGKWSEEDTLFAVARACEEIIQ